MTAHASYCHSIECLLYLVDTLLNYAATYAPWLLGAHLVPLPKPGGGFQQMLVQQALTCLISLCVHVSSMELSKALVPPQDGVGVPSGTDML